MHQFDPDAAATGDGIFGLPFAAHEARLRLLPVPFDATTSYGGGTSAGPAAIAEASRQVDLHDLVFGDVWRAGIHMDPEPAGIAELSRVARAAALPIIEKGGADGSAADARAVERVNQASVQVERAVHAWTSARLDEGSVPGIIGGDHSVPLGAIAAAAERFGGLDENGGPRFGVLQIDAHMDLREAYEGFEQSHASIMFNVLRRAPGVGRLVQVGIRDVGSRERALAQSMPQRVHVVLDQQLFEAKACGEPVATVLGAIVDRLPPLVWLSVDIDGLDPSLCPGTGTPVPGGLDFRELTMLLRMVAQSGRRIVGFDLVEVCPRDVGSDWDANVGARVLYRLCGAAVSTLR